MQIILQGNSVVLRPMKMEEFNLFYNWATKSESTPYWYGKMYGNQTPTLKEFKKDWKNYYFDGNEPEKGRCFLILLNGKPIGQINYNNIDRRNNSVELDIIIGEDIYKNKGYGSDALQTLTKFLFEKMNLEICIINAIKDNPRAIKAYKKAGFKISQKYVIREKEWIRLEKI